MAKTRPGSGAAGASTARQVARRTPQLLLGLVIFGAGMGFVVLGAQGQGPWTVFHEGVSQHTPLTIGAATIMTGAVLVAGLVYVRQPVGFGTLLNGLIVGLATDATLALIDEPASEAVRVAMTLASPLLVALGSGLYLGTMLGPGPRDGVMTAMYRRGIPIWLARLIIEAVPFIIGAILGGRVGWGTLYWLAVIGPAVNFSMKFFTWPVVPSRWIDVFNALDLDEQSASKYGGAGRDGHHQGFPSH